MSFSITTSFRTSAKSTSISHNNRTVNDPLKNDKYHKHIDWDKTDQNIILLSVVVGLKSKEVARITGLTAVNVRQRRSRSLAKMKRHLP